MYSQEQKQLLLTLARDSIQSGLHHGKPARVNVQQYDKTLQEHRACFVTLHIAGQLRGCIGNLQARQPLVTDVSENAFAAAFRDPRFNLLQESEFGKLQLSISVLTPSTPVMFGSEADLINQIRPGIDGLILEEHGNRGTFLPSVWEQLPDPDQFLRHLKQKAGLMPDYWSDSIKIRRYQTESFE